MNKFFAFWGALKAGRQLVNSETWKNRQVTVNMLVGFFASLIVILRLYGVDLAISDDDLGKIAGGVIAISGLFFNTYLTVATTSKIGLPPDIKPPQANATRVVAEHSATENARNILGGN